MALGPGFPASRLPGFPARIDTISFDLSAQGRTMRRDLSWPTWNRVTYTTRVKAGVEPLEAAHRGLAP